MRSQSGTSSFNRSAWPDASIVQQVVGQIPWGHNLLLDLVKNREERLWYAHAAIEHGWSRNVLVLQIESGLYRRQGKSITNFQAPLPKPLSDLAQQIIKDPYNFDFLTLTNEAQERDLERGLLAHLRQFLIELGVGFAFRRQSSSSWGGRRGFQHRSALLSFETEGLRRHRIVMWLAT
jgi:predicted nuclease of restriction endonuclease-like (RecB) superfamily